MVPVFALLCLCIFCFGYQGQIVMKRRQLAKRDLDDLLAQVSSVDRERLTEIAGLYLHPTSDQLRFEPWQMWEAVGGFSGLNRLYGNANAMLDLAQYAERWNHDNGRVLSEIMRRDAERVKRSVFHLQLSFLLHVRMPYTPIYLQEAISSYCLLRERLLGMYRDTHMGLLPRVASAV